MTFEEKYGEDGSIYLGDHELQELQEETDLEEKLRVVDMVYKELQEMDLKNIDEINKKIEELKEILEEFNG